MNRILARAVLGISTFAFACGIGLAQLSFVGNTNLALTNVATLPRRGSFVEPYQTVTVSTQTYPIAPNQTVSLIYTTNNWSTTTTVPFAFDHNVGNNTQWTLTLGPLGKGADVQFYICATGWNVANPGSYNPYPRVSHDKFPIGGTAKLYDNNSGQNFGFLSRYYPAARRGAILQWFSTDYKTIMARLPEVVQAGYGALYLPPPQKSTGGTNSVGYNPYDRFDLGDRLQQGTVRTRYGTGTDLQNLIKVAHRLGIEVYADLVFNHNDNRASTAINDYPGMIPEDFHIHSSADTSNSQVDFNNAPPFGFGTLNYDVSGLVDIAQEDGNLAQTGTFTLPSYASMNSSTKPTFVRDSQTASLYPNHVPVKEDVRSYLLRWGSWLTSLGLDGFRFDAVKHTPVNFFGWEQTQPGPFASVGNLVPYLYAQNPNLFIFGEFYDTDNYGEREYLKSGMNLLDFPLKFNLDSLFNSQGYGSLSGSLTNTFSLDPSTGTPFELGGLATDAGVAFVQSHDLGPPQASNLDHAFVLTRPGSAIVYYDGNNETPGDYTQFPKPGAYDALGAGDNTILKIVDARSRFARGSLVNRYSSNNMVLYERQVNGSGILLVGLNIRGDIAPLSAYVQTSFAPGTVLSDLSGQMPDLTVDGSSKVNVTVPPNSNSTVTNNATGYVLYAPKAPGPLTGVEPILVSDVVTGQSLPFSTYNSPLPSHGPSGSYRAVTSTSGQISLQIQTNGVGVGAFVKVDAGVAIPGQTLLSGTLEGLTDGYFSAAANGNGSFSAPNLDLTGLTDGLHVIRVRVFANSGNGPGVFKDFYTFIYLSKSAFALINGDLTKYGSPQVVQTRTPSSSANRLDSLTVSNDDQYLYIGIAGSVDTSESYTNGISLLMDTDPGAGTGVRTLSTIKDDSGEATRLVSNAGITLPGGFGADYALTSFRGSTLSASPEAIFSGEPVLPYSVGPMAGVFKIDSQLNWLKGVPATIAWKTRTSSGSPSSGLEAAIPLASLYSAGVSSTASIGFVGYLGTSGEKGTVYTSTDPNRALYGNRPPAQSYLTNQFLPTQPNIGADPGTAPVTLSQSYTYTLSLASAAPGLTVTPGQISMTGANGVQLVDIANTSGVPVAGPLYLVVHLNSATSTLTNATAKSLRDPNTAYVKLAGPLAVDAHASVTLTYSSTQGTPTPTFEVKQGQGIL